MRPIVAFLIFFGMIGCAGPRDVAFEMHVIDAQNAYEGAGVFDVNNDGALDIFCGPAWYEGPTWEKHPVREIKQQGGYHLGFCDLPVDVNGDGWTDTVTASWHNKQLSWVRNPGPAGGAWPEIVIDQPGNMETAILADLNADGRPDILPNVFNGEPGWYEFKPDPAAEHGAVWTKHPLPNELLGPGVGAGDVDGDGLVDVVGCKGWARRGADGSWAWQAEFDLVDPGIPILVHDVDGDGDADLIYGIGHDYGLYWMSQERDAVGERTWSRHQIDRTYSQAHVTLLADLNGDGLRELVTGKRYYAHNGKDPGGEDPKCLYYYSFSRKNLAWTRHAIQEGGPAGVGTSSAIADIDRDGDPDLILPGKSGLYLFENLSQ